MFNNVLCIVMFLHVLLFSGAVDIADITVLGCGAISWKPPRDSGGELPGYIVRFFDGATYETSRIEDREIQRSFADDPGRQWAIAENLPSGRTVYADVCTVDIVSCIYWSCYVVCLLYHPNCHPNRSEQRIVLELAPSLKKSSLQVRG